MHFVSTTGGDFLKNGILPRGPRPLRVLRPLVALLMMTGVIPGRRPP